MDSKILAREIEISQGDFINLISKLNDDQLNAIPFPGSWTAGQVADHIIKATDGIPDISTKPADRDPAEQVEAIRSTFLDFTVKFQSPAFVVPDRGPFKVTETLSKLRRIKDHNIKIVLTRDLNEICLGLALPGFGYLTRYEWLKFITFHTQRHTYQLKNIVNKISMLEQVKN